MRIDRSSLLLLFILLSGCVAHSTASDQSAVRTLVKERVSLDLAVQRAHDSENVDADVSALAAGVLSLDSAVRIALLNNRDLRADLLSLGVARGELVSASLFPNPEFEAQVLFPTEGNERPHWELGVDVNLTEAILRGRRQGVAEARLGTARFRVAGALLDLAYQVRLAYYEVQANEQQLELRQTALQAFAASYDTARVLHQAGNVTDLDLATEQAAYEEARIAVAEVEASGIAARERLNILLGLFGRNTEWQIPKRLAEPGPDLDDLSRLESRAVTASIELAATRSTLEATARSVGLTETSGWLPDLNLGVRAEHDGAAWGVGPALSGELPFFNRQQGSALSRRAEFQALRERYVADAVGIRATLRTARARALSAQERVRQYRETVLPLHDRIVNQTLLQYNAMQLGVFQLLQARREQIEAGHRYVTTLHEYWKARAALEQLLAGRLAGTVEVAVEPVRSVNPQNSVESEH